MGITSITQSSGLYTGQTANAKQQWQQNFQSLGSALQSGNLSSAQHAFAQLIQNVPIGQGTTNSAISQNSTLAQDLSSLASSLKSGNLSDAQKAFSKLTQDLTSVGKSHRGHHRHHAPHAAAKDTSAASEATSSADGSIGSTVNTSA